MTSIKSKIWTIQIKISFFIFLFFSIVLLILAALDAVKYYQGNVVTGKVVRVYNMHSKRGYSDRTYDVQLDDEDKSQVSVQYDVPWKPALNVGDTITVRHKDNDSRVYIAPIQKVIIPILAVMVWPLTIAFWYAAWYQKK